MQSLPGGDQSMPSMERSFLSSLKKSWGSPMLRFIFCGSRYSSTVSGCPVPPTSDRPGTKLCSETHPLKVQSKEISSRSTQVLISIDGISKILVKYFLQNNWEIRNNLEIPMPSPSLLDTAVTFTEGFMKEILTELWAWFSSWSLLNTPSFREGQHVWSSRVAFKRKKNYVY